MKLKCILLAGAMSAAITGGNAGAVQFTVSGIASGVDVYQDACSSKSSCVRIENFTLPFSLTFSPNGSSSDPNQFFYASGSSVFNGIFQVQFGIVGGVFSPQSFTYNYTQLGCITNPATTGLCGHNYGTSNFSITQLDGAPLAKNFVAAQPVPEPATWAMLLTGFAGIGAAMRRKARQTVAVSYS